MNKQPTYAVLDVLTGNYNEFRTPDTADDYAADLACTKDDDEEYDIKVLMVISERTTPEF